MSSDAFENLKSEIRDSIDGYIFSLKIFGSLKIYLEKAFKLEVYIERDVHKTTGGTKRPDILIKTPEGFVVVDHKYILSSDERTMRSAINEVCEYNADFSLQGPSFRPEIVMLCPLSSAKRYKSLRIESSCVIWGYELEKTITIGQVVGSVRNPSLKRIFSPGLVFPVDYEVMKFKFIREEPPLPYLTQVIYTILWSLSTEPFKEEFDVSYKIVLEQFNTLFPRWLDPNILQLTPGRLNNSLRFLRGIGWIGWRDGGDKITVFAKRGERMSDVLGFFIDEYARMMSKRGGPRRGRPPKLIRTLEKPTITMDKWLM